MRKNSSIAKNSIKVNKRKKVEAAPWTNTVVSEAEVRQRKIKAERLKEIGVDIYSVDDSSEHENPYRAEAIMLVTCGKPVSTELKKKIHEYDHNYKIRKESNIKIAKSK